MRCAASTTRRARPAPSASSTATSCGSSSRCRSTRSTRGTARMVSHDEILDRLADVHADPGRASGAARPPSSSGRRRPATVGVIASVSPPFCGTCDRVRLTADGQLRNCLFARREADLRGPLRAGATDAELADLVRRRCGPRVRPRHREGRLRAAGPPHVRDRWLSPRSGRGRRARPAPGSLRGLVDHGQHRSHPPGDPRHHGVGRDHGDERQEHRTGREDPAVPGVDDHEQYEAGGADGHRDEVPLESSRLVLRAGLGRARHRLDVVVVTGRGHPSTVCRVAPATQR